MTISLSVGFRFGPFPFRLVLVYIAAISFDSEFISGAFGGFYYRTVVGLIIWDVDGFINGIVFEELIKWIIGDGFTHTDLFESMDLLLVDSLFFRSRCT